MIKQIEIQLNYPFLYKWKTVKSISIITNSEADIYFQLFQTITTEQEAFELLENIDGNFSVVINSDNYFLAAVDRVRSFPLLCKIEDQKIFVTDNISQCERKFIFNETAVSTFKKNYCTEGNDTLLQNWKQLQPGEFIFINKLTGDFSVKRYFIFRNRMPILKMNFVELKKIYLSVFQSILDKIGNKPIIVPLSSGYDSRCIIAILNELNAKNIFAYTYGGQNSFEKQIAKKVAQELNLNWRFIEYNDELLDSFFTEKWENYSLNNHFFTSLPNEQDFFALNYLQKNNLLPKNGVVLSGYLGGAFGGNRNRFDSISADEGDQQEYNFTNRGSKFIVNSIRIYEYFGLEWYMPFVASPILDYCLHISMEERYYRNGYHNFLSEAFFKPLKIDFKKEGHYYQPEYFKNFLKGFLPKKIVEFIQYKNSSNNINDPNNTNYLQRKIAKNLYGDEQKNELTDFNKIYAEYFIRFLKGSKSSNKFF